MKTCPKCGLTYEDLSLNFCLEDGEWLQAEDSQDEASTKVFPASGDPGEAATQHRIVNTDETAVLPTGAAFEPEARRRGPLVIGVISVAIVLLAAGYGIYRWAPWSDKPAPAQMPDISVKRLTGEGKVHEAAISPDGKFLAFLEVKGEKKSLGVKQIETNSTVEILREGEFEDINNVVFSPDGNFVYFAAIDSGKKKSIYKVATLGGSPLPVPIATLSFSLSSDGSKIAYYEDNPKTTETAIMIAESDGSKARKAVSGEAETWVEAGSAWSPDGKQLLVIEGNDKRAPEPALSLAVYSPDDNSLKGLGGDRWDFIDTGGIVWAPSGDFVYLSATRVAGDTMRIWRVSFPDGEAVEITRNDKDYRGLSITSDGTRLVTTEQEIRSGVWVSPDLDPMNAVEVLPGRGDTWGLSWSPDGRIVYISDQSGSREVWIMSADGSGQTQITNDRISKAEPKVSPDGKTVIYFSPIDGFQLYKVPIGGGNPTRIVTGQIGPESPEFSKDGKFIAFSAWPAGKQSIFRVPIAGGRSERLTELPSAEPSYSPDGTMIACFFLAENEQFFSLGVFGADGGAPIKQFEVPATTAAARGPLWTPDGKQITYIVSNGEKSDLWSQPVAGGEPTRLTDFSRPWIQRRDYSWDGKRVAITRGEGLRNAVMLSGLK